MIYDLPLVTQLSKRRTNTQTQIGLIQNPVPVQPHDIFNP